MNNQKPDTTSVYITDASGKQHFRTLCSTQYHMAEVRNMQRRLDSARANPAAWQFLDIATARIVIEHSAPLAGMSDDELLAELQGWSGYPGQ